MPNPLNLSLWGRGIFLFVIKRKLFILKTFDLIILAPDHILDKIWVGLYILELMEFTEFSDSVATQLFSSSWA